MSVVQHDLLGEELPEPVIAFTLVVRWYDNELRVQAIPLMGLMASDFLKNIEELVHEALEDEFTE